MEASYPVVMNHHVKFFVDRFTSSRRDLVGLWLRRSGRYLEMIRGAFRAKGLPEDLAFTAMIESGFDPLAVSRVGAKGLWQFMAPTARLYGLRVDRWVDERLDPEKSTVAAAAYLRDLHVRYGSWELAQAAYNAGAVKVDKAMRATGSGDFWDLTRSRFLRRETKDFVPAIQAATLIGRDPGQYGFELTEATTTEVERVTVPPSIPSWSEASLLPARPGKCASPRARGRASWRRSRPGRRLSPPMARAVARPTTPTCTSCARGTPWAQSPSGMGCRSATSSAGTISTTETRFARASGCESRL